MTTDLYAEALATFSALFAEAKASGLPAILAPVSSARNSRDRDIPI